MQWLRMDLRRISEDFNLTIVLPDGQRSFWIDQEFGLKWGTWVGDELPSLLESSLKLVGKPIIGGLSMGGYGALRAATDYPVNFGAAFSLSGTLDVSEPAFKGRHLDLYRIGFGNENNPRPQDDLINRPAPPLPIFTCCGTEDRLYNQNLRYAEAHPEIKWKYGPGAHNFTFWSIWLPIILKTMSE